jgi:hypothetical protein
MGLDGAVFVRFSKPSLVRAAFLSARNQPFLDCVRHGGAAEDGGVWQHESWRGPACFTAVVILSNLVSTTLSMAVGALAPNNAVANVVGSLAALLSILTGGFLLSKAHLSPVRTASVDPVRCPCCSSDPARCAKSNCHLEHMWCQI